MLKKLFAAALLPAFFLTGCSIFSSDNAREPVKLPDIDQKASVTEAWSASVGDSEGSFLTPALAGNAVYAAGGKQVTRLDAATGSSVWSVSVKDPVTAGVGSDGYYVAVGTEKGEVVALSAEGKELWRRKMTSAVDMPPLVGHDMIIVHTSDTRITAFRAGTGEQVWRYQGQVPVLSLRVPRQMIFFADGILVGQPNGRIIGLSLSGKPALDVAISQPSGITEVERLNDVIGAPLVTPSLLCAATYQGRLTCMNNQNGVTSWTVKVDAASGPTADSRLAFVTDSKGVIHAYSLANGAEAWTNDTMKFRANSAPVAVGGYLACGDYDGYVHLLDPATGKAVGRGRLSGAVVTIPVASGDGAIFQTDGGRVVLVKGARR